MIARLSRIPLFVLLLGLASLAMIVPALHAWVRLDHATGRIFLYGFILGLALTGVLALAMGGGRHDTSPRAQLLTLAAAFAALPVIFALPFHEAVPRASFLDAWFEMVSSFTTTGATLYDNAGRLNPTLHLWRGLVAWLGGLVIWITAFAILAPMNLGGFEVRAATGAVTGLGNAGQIARRSDAGIRILRIGARLAPVYAGLTLVLWVGLLIAGERPLTAVMHAMATLATSGISPVGGVHNGASGWVGEGLILLFLVFAVTRQAYARGLAGDDRGGLTQDPELRLALLLVGTVSLILFLRHFFIGVTEANTAAAAARALWGAIFTTASFLTTTGFESRNWLTLSDWAGLGTPGLVLVGLAVIGGGVATTAGGVKLLRVYALARHSEREAELLIHPSSVGGSGTEARRIRRGGAQIAWVFFMLFALSIVLLMGLLTLTGVQFDTAIVLAIAALSNTGPLAEVASQNPVSWAGVPDTAKLMLAFAMVLGRMEALALIALLNPEMWRT